MYTQQRDGKQKKIKTVITKAERSRRKSVQHTLRTQTTETRLPMMDKKVKITFYAGRKICSEQRQRKI